MNKKQYRNTNYIIYEDGRCYSNISKKFLTPKMSVKYPTYNLTIEGKKKQVKVHRMVAEAFIPNPDNKPIVNHLDGDTHNFSIGNLEWATAKENSKHAAKSGLLKQNNQTAILLEQDYLPDEIWVEIQNYPNYIISNMGRVLNIRTKTLKKTPLDNNGYPHVSLWANNKGKTFQVHRLEFLSFYPEENLDGFVINHIDGNKENNKLNNLEKITYKENNLHAEYVIKTHKTGKKVVQKDTNGNVLNTYLSVAEAQRCTNTSNISRAIKKHYLANGFYWEYI